MNCSGVNDFIAALENGDFPMLRSIDLSSNELVFDGRTIARLASVLVRGCAPLLSTLNLGWNEYGETVLGPFFDEIDQLTQWSSAVTSLDLSRTGKDVTALADTLSLGNLPSLRSIKLTRNEGGDGACVKLAEALAAGHVRQLTLLDLHQAEIRAAGMKARERARALSVTADT